jgi:hypothetical protein
MRILNLFTKRRQIKGREKSVIMITSENFLIQLIRLFKDEYLELSAKKLYNLHDPFK